MPMGHLNEAQAALHTLIGMLLPPPLPEKCVASFLPHTPDGVMWACRWDAVILPSTPLLLHRIPIHWLEAQDGEFSLTVAMFVV